MAKGGCKMKNVSVVTGGARGIGFAIAERQGAAGSAVAIFDVDPAAGAQAVEVLREQGVEAESYTCDVSQREQVQQSLEAVKRDLGLVSILVNNAGIIRDNWLHKISEADWDLVLGVNLKGPFSMCQSVLAQMKERGQGKIVNITSRAWLGNPGQANYSASKGGLVSLTRTLALELAPFDINVNAVAPGLINTPLTQSLSVEVQQKLIEAQPTKKMGTPEDVAAAVAFLASADANFITGQVLYVCGGKSVGLTP